MTLEPNTQAMTKTDGGFHFMAKPAGPICNLDCSYCFYLEKEHFYPNKQRFLMSDALLERYIQQNIAAETSSTVLFTWQGGEPMLRGLEFYRRAIALQAFYANGKTIQNSMQTNGVLLNQEWCEFLAESGFMVGISLDGPKEIHDAARVDKKGRPTFDTVMQAIGLLKQYQIEFNVLVTVTRDVAQHPQQVYQFLKTEGITHIQFNPVVERLPNTNNQQQGLHFAMPSTTEALQLSPFSVAPHEYGQFLITIFDEWVRQDVGSIYVMNFEWALAAWLRLPANVCLFTEHCGKALIIEHNGDVFSCDHFMYPDHFVANLQNTTLHEIANSEQQQRFGRAKSDTLPKECRECDYLFACHGECPKNRFTHTKGGEPGLNYLCPSYKSYFKHIDKYMKGMATLISHQQPAALIMQAIEGPLAIPLAK